MSPPASESEPDDSPPSPPPLAISATRVAIAQICRSVGYHAARPSALLAFSDIAGRYLQSLARSTVSVANLDGRTDANLLDVARAAEELALGRGFRGAWDPRAPLLGSEVLKELMRFVGSVEEVPFARPMPRCSAGGWRTRPPSFAQAGREPPMPHVPAWLPCFPEEGWTRGGGEERAAAAAEEENSGRWGREEKEEERKILLPAAPKPKRATVRFKLRGDFIIKSRKKKQRRQEEEEEDWNRKTREI